MTEQHLTPLDCLYRWEKEHPEDIYLRQPRNRIWQEYSWQNVADEARRMAAALKMKRNQVAEHYEAIVNEYAEAKTVVWE